MAEPMGKIGDMLQVGRTFGVRDGMLRLQYELQRGSGLMSWRMRSVQGWKSWDLHRITAGVLAENLRATRVDGDRKFFVPDVRTLAPKVREVLGPIGERSVIAEAEKILDGNLPFFGQLCFHTGFPPQWFRNPVTGQAVSPQQPWTQMRFASPEYGDLKFILEPSRFLFVYPLLRAYALTGDERFPQAFWNAIENWAVNSPPMSGPLWICGQECSLRILACSFALHGFIHSPSSTSERIALLVSLIAANAWRTAQTLGYARSQRSNHLISEAVGLWTAGTLYPELKDAPVWRNLGAELLHEAVLDHITGEGVSQQNSYIYQRMILHLLLWTVRLDEIQGGASLPSDVRKRAESAFDFMRQWVDPVSGFAPNYGSDDGTLILPLASASYRDFRPLLQLGAAVLNRSALKSGPRDEAALWFGLRPELSEKSDAFSPPSISAGYFRLGDASSWAMIRAGRYTRRPFQADQLHVDLWWRGINIARDPGTYLYNGPAPWDNGFARSAVHNTVTVDGRDQMRRAGRFLWLDWAQASGKVSSSSGQHYVDQFEGEHSGYAKLGIKHRRTVQWLGDAGWAIIDDIEGTGDHHARLHWLAPDLPFEVFEKPFQSAFQLGKSKIVWNIFASTPGAAAIVRAGALSWERGSEKSSAKEIGPEEVKLLGWESFTYGDLRPAVSLIYETQAHLPVRFATVVLTDERCQIEEEGGQVVIARDDCEIYRVELRPEKSNAQVIKPRDMSLSKV